MFDECRGIAIESVDGSHIEDVTISNITMRSPANDPIFIRLGSRLRGPNNPPVGSIKRININNVVVSNANGKYAATISAIPGHYIEDIRIANVHLEYAGGGSKALRKVVPPENEANYPELGMFGAVLAHV